MMKKWMSLLLLAMLLTACSKEQKHEILPSEGSWRAEIRLKGAWLPFLFDLDYQNDEALMIIRNGEERIKVSEVRMTPDSIYMVLPVYHSEIRAALDDDTLRGEWVYLSKGTDYRLPFRAVHGVEERFFPGAPPLPPAADISGKWKAIFHPGEENSETALGIFEQSGDKLKGTFDSPTGDYRFLEGVVRGDSLYLAEFDGAFAYLFKARIGDTIRGIFYSGRTGVYPWVAMRSDSFSLPDPTQITKLKPGEDRITHPFLDLNGDTVTLQDERFLGKALVVEVMGTWCPNCKDEAILLSQLYEKYKDQGLEVVSLAYERSADFEKERKNIEHMRKSLNLPYTVLFAGKIGEVEKQLPIEKLYSYPTTFFIDRQGRIRKIHTGFSGPATGENYQKSVATFEKEIRDILE